MAAKTSWKGKHSACFQKPNENSRISFNEILQNAQYVTFT